MLKDNLARFVSSVYNFIRPEFRITVFVGTSAFLTGLLAIITASITNFHSDNSVVNLLVVLLLVIVTAVFNELQARLRELGDKLKAEKGDPKVLEIYQEKEKKAQKVVQIAKKNQ